MERGEEIRQIAYQVWEEEGRPNGRDLEHWLRAEAIWQKIEPSQSEPPSESQGTPKRVPRSRTGTPVSA
jgi:hypothetical protein